MASSSRGRYSEDSPDLSPRYNRILFQTRNGRDIARRSSDRYKSTLVGSEASGVAIEDSDGDILIEPRNITIDESSLIYRDDLPCYVRISTEGLSGPLPIVLLGDGKYMLADPVRSMNEDIFGEIKQFGKQSGLSKVGNIHIGWRNRSIDLVPQLRIGGIPQIVRSFATRGRSWPSADIISIIRQGEFHLAARPAPSRSDRAHDFCLSFAKAEVVLLRTMSAKQLVTVKWLKIIGRVIDSGRGVLTSYHLKTSAFWYFEKTDARFWENHLPLVDILKRIDKYLHDRFLPHYFVPGMNMLIDVSESDLIYVRRRIWSYLGFCLITDDIAGVTSRASLNIATDIFTRLGKHQSLSEQHPDLTQTDYMYNIRNILETAEVMHGTGIVSCNVMKQRLSASVIMRCPEHVVRRDYIESCKQMLTSFNITVHLWISNRVNEDASYEDFIVFMSAILNSNKDTLEELFMLRSTTKHNRDQHAVRRELRESEIVMNKWLSFTDDFINKLKPYGNIVADQVLRGISHKSRGENRVSDNKFEENIDILFNKITKELLTFAAGHIKTFSYPLGNDTYPIRSVPFGDYVADFRIFFDVIDRLFLNVEYALVTSARIKASRGSGDQTGRIKRTMNDQSIEYRCYSSFTALVVVTREFSRLCWWSDSHQGLIEFMAATLHREQCS